MSKKTQKCPPAPTAEVPFPNRRFGYTRARTPDYAQYESSVWGAIAVCNMQLHDTFLLGRDERVTIVAITDKTFKYVDASQVTHTVRNKSVHMKRFAERAGDRLALECISQNNLLKTEKDVELTAIFMRDPAAARDAQSIYLLTH